MPNKLIKAFAKKSGKSVDYIEDKWNELEQQYKDDSDKYQKIVGVLKKILKIQSEESMGGITTSSAGNVSSYGGQGNFAPKMSMVSRFSSGKTYSYKPPKKKKKKTYKEYIDYKFFNEEI